MPLSINTNIASMTAQRSFLNSNQALETAFERLSTGKRINSAVDDGAGLAIGRIWSLGCSAQPGGSQR